MNRMNEQNEFLEDDPGYQEKHLSLISEPSHQFEFNKKNLASSQSKRKELEKYQILYGKKCRGHDYFGL